MLGTTHMKIAIITLATVLLAGCAPTSKTQVYPLNARFQKAWPGKSDLEWFHAAEGKREIQILKEYGSPKEKQAMPDGTARWRYPWLAIAELTIKDGVVVRAYYDAGY